MNIFSTSSTRTVAEHEQTLEDEAPIPRTPPPRTLVLWCRYVDGGKKGPTVGVGQDRRRDTTHALLDETPRADRSGRLTLSTGAYRTY